MKVTPLAVVFVTIFLALDGTLSAAPATRPAGKPPADAEPRTFVARCVVSRPDAVKPAAVAWRPTLVVAEGQPASISTGYEVPSSPPAGVQSLNVGLSIGVTVTAAADGTLRAHVRFADARLAEGDKDNPIVSETAVATVRALKLKEPITLTLADGTTLQMTWAEAARVEHYGK